MSTIVSLDLDDLPCYAGVHGLEVECARGLALERWLPRFLDVFASFHVHATIFVIGSDLEWDLEHRGGRGAEVLLRALHEGHELANHSYSHAYDLSTKPASVIAEDLGRCDALLRQLGAAPIGFRAPGYTHDRAMLLQAAGLGYRYDSSMLPSPTYYLAKLGVLGLGKLRGKRSVSQAHGGRGFIGPTAVHYLPEIGLWEIPISVSRSFRLPMTGTFLLGDAPPMLPKLQGEALRREAATTRHLHLELHAIDLADPPSDGVDPEVVAAQRELMAPVSRRLERLGKLLKARGGGSSIARAMGPRFRGD